MFDFYLQHKQISGNIYLQIHVLTTTLCFLIGYPSQSAGRVPEIRVKINDQQWIRLLQADDFTKILNEARFSAYSIIPVGIKSRLGSRFSVTSNCWAQGSFSTQKTDYSLIYHAASLKIGGFLLLFVQQITYCRLCDYLVLHNAFQIAKF